MPHIVDAGDRSTVANRDEENPSSSNSFLPPVETNEGRKSFKGKKKKFKVKKKVKRVRKYAGSDSSLDSIRSKNDATVVNDNELESIRHGTQESIEMIKDGHSTMEPDDVTKTLK